MQNADLHDGDEGNHYRLFDLLDFSGENKSVMITRQLATAAHSVIAGKVAELTERAAVRISERASEYLHDYLSELPDKAWEAMTVTLCEIAQEEIDAALAPYPERRSEHHE